MFIACSSGEIKENPIIDSDDLENSDTSEVYKGMAYLENSRLKLGVDLSLGGAVTYLSDEANGGKNMINSYDWGRQIQMSYYSGPRP